MVSDLCSPMVAAEVDLRDLSSVPLDVAWFTDGPLATLRDAEAFRAAFRLWCAAWHEVPAASLPDDDAALCRLAGLGRRVATWRRFRERGALRGWTLCSDGRLYHPLLAEHAANAWAFHLRLRARVIRRLEMESGVWADMRRQVFARDGYACRYCSASNVRLECDHVVPLSRGGVTHPDNLATACRSCNRKKAARTPQEWQA